jgi:hypothetical protein
MGAHTRRYAAYLKERARAAEEDQVFPDEVDTPRHIPARTRFQRYRGLKSFRTSPWDPYENLPVEYAKVFQFENWNGTRKRVETEGKEGGVRVSRVESRRVRLQAWALRPASTSADMRNVCGSGNV